MKIECIVNSVEQGVFLVAFHQLSLNLTELSGNVQSVDGMTSIK
jgi:hypothetical protein